MFHSLRYNIYFFLALLAAVSTLWLVYNTGNRAIRNQQHIHARIVKLNSQFSQFVLQEQTSLGNEKLFNELNNQQKLFFKQCISCHLAKTTLPEQRLAALADKQEILLKIAELRRQTRQRLSSLFDSVHYIHEHHIVTLQNYVQYSREESERPQKDEMRKVYADEAALEPEIIRQAVMIQHQLANIIYDFNMLTGGDPPEQIQQDFQNHVSKFYAAIKAFEEFSLDAQDGLLVEELLESGRILDTSFVELINLEKKSRKLTALLEINHQNLEASFVHLEALLQARQDALMERMTVINWILLLLAASLILTFLVRARSVVQAVDELVAQTEKITHDISYQIPEQSFPLTEFNVLRTALNAMAADLNGKVQSLTKEIQTRRRMEVLLSQGEKEWVRTFDAVPDKIFILDRHASILRANRAMLELLDCSIEDIAGRKCYEVVHQSDTFPSYCTFFNREETNPKGAVPTYQQHEFYEPHFERYFTANMSPLFDSSGQLTGYVHLMRDVSSQKKAEQEKQNYALYLDSILSSSAHTAIIATDQDLCIKYFNPVAERIFHVRAAEVLGSNVHQIHKKLFAGNVSMASKNSNLPGTVARTLKSLQEGGVHSFSFTYGTVVIEARLSVIRSSAGESIGFLLMANDISKQVKASEQRKIMSERLLKAEKMEAIGLMAGGVAHDLNNILSGIINYPELMLLQMKDDTTWKEPLEAIRDSGQRAAAIVADLLTIARGVACEKEILSINALIDQYLASPEFAGLAARFPEITVTTILAPDLRFCLCSSVHIQKILMNLVANGFEAIGDKGTVTVTTGNIQLSGDQAREHKLEPGHYIQLVITDTGKGVTCEDIQHMFEPFYSKKKMGHSGTGLGLAVVWNTVQDHKGTISVAREEQGSSFTLLLPAVEQKSAPKKTSMEGENIQGCGSVLVVDDEALQRDVAGRMLSALGYDVAVAANGREAVRYVRQQSVDLIILDMIMEPDMNGRQTLKKILEIRPDQKTLIASGYAESSEVKKACTMGHTTLMNKPYTMQKLAESVQQALAA